MSVGDSEKNAISDPEANPETKRRRHDRTPENTAPAVGVRR
jgi:hypothetical protein